ncbi:hypothetical protein PIB30_033041 [Stylosanthes scabra]|uniref:Uncharacterized protein n=1 Tax=Stylosanthes scabra TaxID=79078 RepID=A0ABU6XC40_9FABA|nr:hypothetical protein [Stylosanthes scabra]
MKNKKPALETKSAPSKTQPNKKSLEPQPKPVTSAPLIDLAQFPALPSPLATAPATVHTAHTLPRLVTLPYPDRISPSLTTKRTGWNLLLCLRLRNQQRL